MNAFSGNLSDPAQSEITFHGDQVEAVLKDNSTPNAGTIVTTVSGSKYQLTSRYEEMKAAWLGS